jgi:hypothetical protein
VTDPRLARAKARLDRLDWYPRPVSLRGVRLVVAPWFFRLPFLRRYDGYCLLRAILLRSPRASDDLITHELCHVWQIQHRPVRFTLTWALSSYAANPFEQQARAAVLATRDI